MYQIGGNILQTNWKKKGINVLTISSDSDPRYNAAMRRLSKLGCDRGVHAVWFSCAGKTIGPFYVQDTIHIGTKLRNFFLRTILNRSLLPFGEYFIDWNHLNVLLEKFAKDQHQLTASVLNPIDRQNFHSVLRMCDPKVIALLKSHVKGSEATVLYLQMMKDVIDAFMNQDLKYLQRVRKMWYSLFIARIWRSYVWSSKKYTLKKNFLTSACYSCLEINAHSLIMSMIHLKTINRPDLFLPHLFESQPCESIFGQFRSFTTTYSTKTNCTVKEAMSRISKIQLQNDVIHKTSPNFVYPRFGKQQNSNHTVPDDLPTKEEIIAEIQKCQRDAIAKAKSLGLIPRRNHRFKDGIPCKLLPYDGNKIKKRNVWKKIKKAPIDPPNFNNIQLKNFAHKFDKEIEATSPYVEIITDDNKRIVVKKMSLCWLWRSDSRKMSNDRLLRVQHSTKQETHKQKMKKFNKPIPMHVFKKPYPKKS